MTIQNAVTNQLYLLTSAECHRRYGTQSCLNNANAGQYFHTLAMSFLLIGPSQCGPGVRLLTGCSGPAANSPVQ
jgi:hypothetical protein